MAVQQVAAATAKKFSQPRYIVDAAIVVCIMLFFRFIPPFGAMTPYGMTVLGIFIGAIWGWIRCDMAWPSILALVMLGFTEQGGSVSAVLASASSTMGVQMILALMLFSAILSTSGVSEQLAKRIMASKVVKGRPWLLTVFVYLASFIPAAFGATFASIIICWEFVYSISEQVGYTPKDKWPKMCIVAAVLACCVGTVSLPFSGAVAATFGYLVAVDPSFTGYNFLFYFLFSLAINAGILALFMVLCKVFYRPDMSKLAGDFQLSTFDPFTKQQKIALVALVALFVITILPSCLPDCGLRTALNTIGTTGCILLITAVVAALRYKDGLSPYPFQELGKNGVFWGMLFMVAAAITMGFAIASEDAGFTASIIGPFGNAFGHLGAFGLSVLVIVATIVLTNFVNNAVACAVMVPVMYSFAVAVGANPIALTAMTGFLGDSGLMLPSAGPYAAMLHGNKKWVSMKDIAAVSILGIAAVIVSCMAIGIPLGNVLLAA